LSGELPLIQEGMERSNSFLMSPSASGAHGDSDEDDETEDAIRDYIDRVESKNLKSAQAEQKESASAGSILKLRSSAMKTPTVIPEPFEPEKEMAHIPRDDDIENQKTYSQKELDKAKKQLQRAFLEFYRSLSLLSSYRYVII